MNTICRDLADGGSLVYAWFEAMHTRIDLVLWDRGVDVEAIKTICTEIEREVRRIEKLGSCFDPDSELFEINSAPSGISTSISEEMCEILSRCIDYNESSEGYFDVTAVAGRKTNTRDNLSLNGKSVVRKEEDIKINLSGFLKGYALDKAVEMVCKAGVSNALLNFGNSSIGALGNHPLGEGWIVATAMGERFHLKNNYLTTSGNENEKRRHIIDPLTGNVMEGKGMVSVITATAEAGEVQSTTLFIRKNTEKTDNYEN